MSLTYKSCLYTDGSGTYTFYTTSYDGSRVFIDSQMVVDNSGYHGTQERSGAVRLWEGYHSVVVDYFVGPSMASFNKAVMIAQYSGPDTKGEVEILPASHDAALEKNAVPEEVEVEYAPGWWGGYYLIGQYMAPVIEMTANGPVVDVATLQPNITSISEAINFNTRNEWYAISERIPRGGTFAAKWIGNLEIETEGLYTFYTSSDDGSRLWINNQMVVNNGGYHAALQKSGSLHLWKGVHSIVADFFHAGGTASMKVTYRGPDTSNAQVLVKAQHQADLDNNTALQPIQLPEEPEWEPGFWGQYFWSLQFGAKGPTVDVSTLTPNFQAASPEINYRAYITENGHSALTAKVAASNPASVWCVSGSKYVSSCGDCPGGGCSSPAAVLENRDTENDVMWHPEQVKIPGKNKTQISCSDGISKNDSRTLTLEIFSQNGENYGEYYVVLDVGTPAVVKAVLWANDGDTTHDPGTLNVYSSSDAVNWIQVAELDLLAFVGGKEEAVVALPQPYARAARFWKLNPTGIAVEPRPRSMGLCDTSACGAMPGATGQWAVGEETPEDFPVNGFAAKWIGNVEIKTAGWYTFYLSSRDGARLYVDDQQLIDSYRTKGAFRKPSSEVFLWAGYHALVADMWKAPQGDAAGSKAVSASGPTADAGWTRCANDLNHATLASFCDCEGTVRYGLDGSWTEKKVSGSVACTSRQFLTDPAPGEAKTCECKAFNAPKTNVDDDRFAVLEDDASVMLEYKGPDTYDSLKPVQAVHDPALEGEAPASDDAAEAAMHAATLISRETAVLAAARTKGAELAGALSRLRAQENQLRQKEQREHLTQLRPHIPSKSPLVRELRHGPIADDTHVEQVCM